MSSCLPAFPRTVFTIIEPISLVAGFIGVVIDPAWFIGEQTLQHDITEASMNSITVAWQLGNLYLLMAIMGVAILFSTSEIKVVRAYLIALWIGDIGHLFFTSCGLGWEASTTPLEWNAMTWGNIGMTLFLFFTRTAYLTGLFGPDHGRAKSAAISTQPSRATRSTQKQNTAAPAPAPAPSPVVTRISQPPESVKPNRVLQKDPVPRRNAPHYARSPSSIPSIPLRPDDETEFYDEDEEYETGLQDEEEYDQEVQDDEVGSQLEVTEHREQSQVDLVIDPAQQKILQLTAPDLARAADSLFACLQQRDPDQDIFRGSLSIKRRAFYNIRAEYYTLDQEGTEPFIDFAQFLTQNFTPSQVFTASLIARSNVVSAFDKLYDIKEEEASDTFTFLQTLNKVMPSFFTIADGMFQHAECTLDLRTWLFVQVFSQPDNEIDYRDLLASLFCRDPERLGTNDEEAIPNDYPTLFAGKYFRELGGKDHDLDELCSTRISHILGIVRGNNRDVAAAQLIEEFPVHNLVDELQKCWVSLYKLLSDEESVRAVTEPPIEYQQGMDDSQSGGDFGSESQSIVRIGSQEVEPSLFVDQTSLRALHGDNRARLSAPPPNQQRAVSGSAVPHDYYQHTNADLMRSPFPPARSLRLGHNANANNERGQKRPRPIAEDDEEDPFETDSRHVDPAKRDELRRRMPPPPVPQPVSRPPQKHGPAPPQSSGSDFPSFQQESSLESNGRLASKSPSASMPDFDAIRIAASQRAKEARMADNERQGGKQRVQWSQHDSQVLIDLIAEYGVRWSTIENHGGKLFEYPRNQQAYRDRARNIKTELLIIDVALPPNFDGVALSNKEIQKIKAAGKNPHRRENDVDEQGNPINTELAEHTPF
ncbi:hypothetical protein FGRMN_7223 [Fusarium graminum]|nr:hypothetical protein FGRMN_7223 [Fusarium graminum]